MKYPGFDIDIRKVQEIQIEILLELDRICKKHNIKYQLFAGTLLGAVRHKGFIPWDDDVDVGMLRKDYNRFIEVCSYELDNQYFLQTYKSDPQYALSFAKIRKNNTLFVEKALEDKDIHHGIYIDIFPLDNVRPNDFIGKVQRTLLNKLWIANIYRLNMQSINIKTSFKSYMIHYFVKLIPSKVMNILIEKLARMFEKNDTVYISHLLNGASKERYYKYMMKRSEFEDMIEIEFEGYNFPIPRDYDSVLKKLYGSYMEKPPIERQKPHHGIVKLYIE